MKQAFFILITVFAITSCRFTTGSGNIITETRSVNNFDKITVGGGFEVEVKIGTVTSVVVEADDNIMKFIETTTSGHTLQIRTEDLHSYSDVHMKVYVTTPSLVNINASASADVTVEDVITNAGKLTFKSSSGSSIKAKVDAPDVYADVSSGGTIDLNGKVKNYKAEASSGSEIKSWDLLSENTEVNVSSGGTAAVHASVSLDAKASSGGTVTYHGAALVSRSINSGGSINKKD